MPVAGFDEAGFQSTLPHGERRCAGQAFRRSTDFNPRSRMGSDAPIITLIDRILPISIHAPAWGATTVLGGTLLNW